MTAAEAATAPGTALVLYRPPVPEPDGNERLTCDQCGSQAFKLVQELITEADVEEFTRDADGELVAIALYDTDEQIDCRDDHVECRGCGAYAASMWQWDG
ncbi:MAG: hypothetical protein JWL97_4244 [Gemmatimonadales bacterium]|nr:hypothetical protein [Gemmatimonadales bacterium]